MNIPDQAPAFCNFHASGKHIDKQTKVENDLPPARVMGSSSRGVVRDDLPERVVSELINPMKLNLQMRKQVPRLNSGRLAHIVKIGERRAERNNLRGKALGGRSGRECREGMRT